MTNSADRWDARPRWTIVDRSLQASAGSLGRPISRESRVLRIGSTVKKRAVRRHCAEETLAQLGELTAGIAHELNNPLASIIGYANLLQESDLPQVYHEDLKIIFRQADRARAALALR